MSVGEHESVLPETGSRVAAVDLFCGAGGLTYGLRKRGIDVRLGVDIDPDCAFPYSANNPAKFLQASVRDLSADELRAAFGDAEYKLIAGCAPCQPFSTYSQARPADQDERWNLLDEFARLVEETGANLVTMENVPKLEHEVVFRRFKAKLEDLGFTVRHWVVDCSELGMPQQRRRLVLLASQFGELKLRRPSAKKIATVRDVIGGLPPITAGARHPDDPLHSACEMSEMNLRRIRASRPGGSWRDWPEELVAECHRRDTGRRYSSVYGRMSWNEPSPTITTQFYGFGNGRFGHPEQDRGLSLREGAMLQGFPRKYAFVRKGDPVRRKAVAKLIGNAVPVGLGSIIGKSVTAHVTSLEARE